MVGVIWVMEDIVRVCKDCRGVSCVFLFQGLVKEGYLPHPGAHLPSVRCGFLCSFC